MSVVLHLVRGSNKRRRIASVVGQPARRIAQEISRKYLKLRWLLRSPEPSAPAGLLRGTRFAVAAHTPRPNAGALPVDFEVTQPATLSSSGFFATERKNTYRLPMFDGKWIPSFRITRPGSHTRNRVNE